MKPRGAGLISAYVTGKRILTVDVRVDSDVNIRHFQYRNDNFQSDILFSDIVITDVDVGNR